MEEVLGDLAEAINGMKIQRVPPPVPFKGVGQGDIKDFFDAFEKYCDSVYKKEYSSYLQVLPSFLENEAKSIVLAYGTGDGVDYRVVKDRVIAEISTRRTLGANQYTDFFSAKRLPNESLVCFSIRLESLATKMPNATADTKNVMTRSKFISDLSPTIIRQLNLQFGNENDATLAQIVRLASVLEEGNPNIGTVGALNSWPVSSVEFEDGYSASNYPAPMCCNVNPLTSTQKFSPHYPVKPSPRANSDFKCFGCGEVGHMRNKCPKSDFKCFRCNKRGHFANKCTESNGSRSDGISNVCSFCGEGSHALMECKQFQNRFLLCVWCGASDHASHLCTRNPGNGNVSDW